jgi:hypothetical protein
MGPRTARQLLPDFKPKNPELMVLDSYEGTAPQEFWDTFPSNRDLEKGPPFVLNGDRFLSMAEELGVTSQCMVEEVVQDIREGCDLKINESRCPPTITDNSPSVLKNGREVADVVATW